jgi:hypothetical protein
MATADAMLLGRVAGEWAAFWSRTRLTAHEGPHIINEVMTGSWLPGSVNCVA